uniref:C14orf166 n=1 Tax=Caligus rogercresseyi TaxID=217165 RepID=C1BN65_CALRO|nr:C14orf166 [Caligus rogercresseyi]
MQVYKRRLEALTYPHNFNIEDEASCKELISWLEENKIKSLPNGPQGIFSSWPKSFEDYLRGLGYSESSGSRESQVLWLLSKAVKIEYKALRYQLPDPSSLSLNTDDDDMANKGNGFIDTVDLHSQELQDAVHDFASKLKMTKHPDHLLMLEACCKYINKCMALKNTSTKDENVLTDIESNSLGLQDIQDPVVLTAAKVLRLLHISSLRELQNNINQVIVKIQGITANPKTDTSLGKVGR